MSIQEPLDLVRLALCEQVVVKCRGERLLTGKLHAYDAHLNIVLGDVTESVPSVNDEGQTISQQRRMEMLFVRGDGIILISTQS
jgi:U6 snRNA-associated Sm-like protein LSm3